MTFKPDANLAEQHARWLAGFDPRHRHKWESLLGNDPEAARCEAHVRLMLADNGNHVVPNEDLAGGDKTPDFLCQQAGQSFYVEVTCLSIDKVTEVTGFPDVRDCGEMICYAPLNSAIFNACRQKTPQCAGLDHPCLVAVGTFHFEASKSCVRKLLLKDLLTGSLLITCDIDGTGAAVGDVYQSTRLESAAFIRPDEDGEVEHARRPVSGIVVCGFGCHPPNIFGVLHPSPARQFDRRLLPNIKFCRLTEGYDSGMMSTDWQGWEGQTDT